MNNFNDAIYNPDFDLMGPHLVAASAGTGKTYNIQNIYARLIAEKGFLVSQIQVMTFTEAATHELRDRIRKILMVYSNFLANGVEGISDGEVERIERLWACAKSVFGGDEDEAKRIVRGRIEIALMQFDQASISTIHGFCRRILSRFAFETNSAFNAELEDRKLYDLSRMARDWYRNQINNESSSIAINELSEAMVAISQKNGWSLHESEQEGSLLSVAQNLLNSYENDRSRRDVQSFDDLLKALRDALCDEDKGEALAVMLREEYKAALIDEFQDTDPVQYEIFRRIFLDVPEDFEKPSIFFVGDPKQAIYAFRGGDIYTYREAAMRDDIAGENTFQLNMNFRSTPKLIDAVNLLFKDKSDGLGNITRTFGDDTIPYEEDLKASDSNAPFVFEDGRADPTPFRALIVDNSQDRVHAVVDSVLEMLSERVEPKITPKDIAILSPSHDGITEYANALRKKGIPIVIQNSANVFASQIAKEFYLVIQAMALMGGRRGVKAALFTSFFDYETKNLADDGDVGELADAIAFFSKINHIWLTKGFRTAFTTLETYSKCNMRERFAKMENGERLLADILQIVDLATEASLKLGPSPDILVNWIVDRINKALGDESKSEEYAQELESEDDAVRLMTMHVSKGLQFPVVIVPLSSDSQLRAPYFYHSDNKFFVSTLDESKEPAKRENDDEKMRLQYVAFTRAIRRTIVISAIAGRFPNRTFAKLLDGVTQNCAIDEEGENYKIIGPIRIENYFVSNDEKPNYTPPKIEAPALNDAKATIAFSAVPIRGSYSSLTPTAELEIYDGHDYDDADTDMAEEFTGDDIFSVPGGAKTGTCWHEILEKVPFDISDAELQKQVELSMRLHGLTTPDETLFSSRVEIVSAMMTKTLDYKLQAPNGEIFSLRDVALVDRVSEWEFDFSSKNSVETTAQIAKILQEEWASDSDKKLFLEAVDGWNRVIPKGYLKGFLDLLFRHNGYYYIVDWKSNSLNLRRSSFCKEGITVEIASKGYFFQYLLYSVVVHRFLKEKLGNDYSWEKCFGGIRYYFLRGIAAAAEAPVFIDRPSEQLLDRLSVALGLEDK